MDVGLMNIVIFFFPSVFCCNFHLVITQQVLAKRNILTYIKGVIKTTPIRAYGHHKGGSLLRTLFYKPEHRASMEARFPFWRT